MARKKKKWKSRPQPVLAPAAREQVEALVALGEAPAPVAAAGIATEQPRPTEGGAIQEKGRVLLLDDEFEFRELIRGFLAENGYTVVAVENGVDGVREVLAGDFSLILCDMRMPKVSGEVFYRAIERIRPHLCGRFVFMSGQGGDAETTEFLDSVSGFMLRKPFPLNDLLDWIAVAEVCGAHGKVLGGSSEKAAAPGAAARPEKITAASPAPQASAAGNVTAPEPPKTVPVPKLSVPPAGEPQEDRAGGPGVLLFATLAVLVFLVAVLWNRYWDARDRLDAAAAERLARETAWTAISPDLEAAIATRADIESAQRQLARITADRETPRWTPALRSIVTTADAGIEIVRLRGRGEPADSGACELRVFGVASGAQPRQTAERFRKAIESDLGRIAGTRQVTARFEKLDDAPGGEPEKARADFVVFVSLGPMDSAVAAARKEGN